MYFDKEARCVTDTSWLIHVACKAGVFCCAIDLDFRLTESWGESKNDSIQQNACSEAIIHPFGEEGAQMFKKSAFDLNSAFYP